MSVWQLEVLGDARLRGEGRTFTPERKTAALLAYLALEGATPRSRLAGLFWPGSLERTARNNLAALGQRLKRQTGAPLFAGADVLRPTSALEVDVAALKIAALTGERRTIIDAYAPLLGAYDYDDLPEFGEWLLAERERLDRLHRKALAAEIAELEERGGYREAVLHAERLLFSDPASEEAHRHLMRLLFLAGDRPAALGTYARLTELLRREFGVAPLPETTALAREIESAAATTPAMTAPATRLQRPASPIPLRILRPPLVGREQEWARLEAAWEEGRAIFVSGPPGVGKSRLVMDFARARGSCLQNEGRPGDALVPFASLARVCRDFLSTFSETELAPWVRSEIARLLPDLADEPPPPMRSREDELRLHEAVHRLFLAMTGRVATVVIDDLQFCDASSLGAFTGVVSRLACEEDAASRGRVVVLFRRGDVTAETMAGLDLLVEHGRAVHVELEPLGREAVPSLLQVVESDLDERERARLGGDLYRYTGGNPLFLIEALKYLLETGQLGPHLPRPLALGGKVGSLIAQRLDRLSLAAQRLVWVAAVAQTDFDAELASCALEQGILDLAPPFGELERAQIFDGSRFSHDLLYEAALGSIPAPIRTALHRRCATCLEGRGGSPARIAQHHLEAGDEAEAAPFLLEAARAAEGAYRLAEAATLYERAAALLEALGADGAFAAWDEAVRLLQHFDRSDRIGDAIRKLVGLAGSAEQHAKARHAEAVHLGKLGAGEEAEKAARAGLRHAEAGAPRLEGPLLTELGTALWLQDRLEEAFEVFGRALAASEALGSPSDVALGLTNVGVALDHLERHREAAERHRRAERMFGDLGDKVNRVTALNNLSISQLEQGLVHASLDTLEASLALAEEVSGSEGDLLYNLTLLGACQSDLGRYAEALETFERARDVARRYDTFVLGSVQRHRAATLLTLGRFQEADECLDAASRQPNLPSYVKAAVWLTRADLSWQRGSRADEALEEARRLVEASGRKLLWSRLWSIESRILPPEEGLRAAEKALQAASGELKGLRIGAETRCAQIHLALGDPARARRHVRTAIDLLAAHHPTDFYLGEVLFTHYRALGAGDDPAAPEALRGALEWVMETAERRTPPEHRRSFLEDNPINRAVLEAAHAARTPRSGRRDPRIRRR